MFHFGKSEACKEMEKLLDEVQMNLENNYKDLAIGARKEAVERLTQMKEQGALTDKEYQKYEGRLDGYSKRMEGYSHRLNVKF